MEIDRVYFALDIGDVFARRAYGFHINIITVNLLLIPCVIQNIMRVPDNNEIGVEFLLFDNVFAGKIRIAAAD
jgi:hypothetical protein